MKKRALWQVLPQRGVFRWKLVKDGVFVRSFFFQYRAIAEACAFMRLDWDTQLTPSELLIHNREGRIREKNTFPRSTDPRESAG